MWSRCSLGALRADGYRIRYHRLLSLAFTARFSSGSITTMGPTATATVDTTERLAKLRELLKTSENNVKAFVVPSEDQRTHFYETSSGETKLNPFWLSRF
jgi:Xaa-Pro aminopeptidase